MTEAPDAPERGASWPRADHGTLDAAALYGVALALHLHAARALGPTVLEPGALDEVMALASRLTPAPGLLARLADTPVQVALPGTLGPALIARWLPQSLTALRGGALAIAALLTPIVYGLARPALGRGGAALAALLALLVPRALVEGATLGGEGVLTTLIWGALLLHLRSRGRPERALLAAFVLGLALAQSSAALLVVPALLLAQRRFEGPAPRGQLRAPLAVIALAALGPVGLWMATPALWRLATAGARVRDAVVRAASPQVAPGLWEGASPEPADIPRFHTALTLLTALPSLTLLLTLAGVAVAVRGPRRRSPELDTARMMLAVFALWPLLTPPALGRFPGHFAVVVPACGLLAAAGAQRLWPVVAGWVQERRGEAPAGSWAAALVLAWPLSASVVSPATLSADASWLSGGTWRLARQGTAPLHDGSPAGALGARLDPGGRREVRVYSPEVPYGVWGALHRHGRLGVEARAVERLDAADVAVLSGEAAAPAGFRRVSELRRDGQRVVSLYAR